MNPNENKKSLTTCFVNIRCFWKLNKIHKRANAEVTHDKILLRKLNVSTVEEFLQLHGTVDATLDWEWSLQVRFS